MKPGQKKRDVSAEPRDAHGQWTASPGLFGEHDAEQDDHAARVHNSVQVLARAGTSSIERIVKHSQLSPREALTALDQLVREGKILRDGRIYRLGAKLGSRSGNLQMAGAQPQLGMDFGKGLRLGLRIRKSHVRAYDRHTSDGRTIHVPAYEDSRHAAPWHHSPQEMLTVEAVDAKRSAVYFTPDGTPLGNSRFDPQPESAHDYPVGTWRRFAGFAGNYGYDVEQLQELDPHELLPSEWDWKDRHEDVVRYTQWAKEGKKLPPISVVETDSGKLKVTDGHRRWQAAMAAGVKVRAWVSPAADVPGKVDYNGQPIKTGLTYELAALAAHNAGETLPEHAHAAMAKVPYLGAHLRKSHIATYTRTTKAGKVVVVPAHDDKRTKKQAPPAQPRRRALDEEFRLPGAPNAAEEYRQHGTQAPAFLAWFGDWRNEQAAGVSKVRKKNGAPQETYQVEPSASKVLGPNGQPRVVYHGTSRAQFRAWDPKKQDNSALMGPGFYFTEEKAIAETYVRKDQDTATLSMSRIQAEKLIKERVAASGLSPGDKRRVNNMAEDIGTGYVNRQAFEHFGIQVEDIYAAKDTGHLMEVFLNVRKPFDSDQDQLAWDQLPPTVQARALKGGAKSGQPVKWAQLVEVITPHAINVILRRLGYDGITHIGGQIMGDGDHRVWIAFEPTQIKATANEGTFNPHEADMFRSLGASSLPHVSGGRENLGSAQSHDCNLCKGVPGQHSSCGHGPHEAVHYDGLRTAEGKSRNPHPDLRDDGCNPQRLSQTALALTARVYTRLGKDGSGNGHRPQSPSCPLRLGIRIQKSALCFGTVSTDVRSGASVPRQGLGAESHAVPGHSKLYQETPLLLLQSVEEMQCLSRSVEQSDLRPWRNGNTFVPDPCMFKSDVRNEPRVPKGKEGGGQWTKVGAGEAHPDGHAPSTPEQRALVTARGLAPIPPTSWGLQVAEDPDTPIQATWFDGKGKKQYRYSNAHNEAAADAKFGKIEQFHQVLPRLRRQIRKDLRGPEADRSRVAAAIVAIIDATMMRIGSEEYAEAHGTYGAASLRKEHATVKGNTVQFAFSGKHAREWDRAMKDPQVAAVVGEMLNLPGEKLFQYRRADGKLGPMSETQVNDYLRPYGVTAKQFRTYHASRLAAEYLEALGPPADEKSAQRNIAKVCQKVAKQLGNTPAVCRSSYINPAVLSAYAASELSLKLFKALSEADFGALLAHLKKLLAAGRIQDEDPFPESHEAPLGKSLPRLVLLLRR